MDSQFREKLFDFCKETYFFQFERRERINTRIGLLFAVVTIVANIAIKYLDDLPGYAGCGPVLIFYILLTVALTLGIIALFNILRALANALKWKYPPNPKQILTFVEVAEARNKKVPLDRQTDVRGAFETNLIRQFADAATHNDAANNIKNRHLLQATLWTVATFVALIACSPFYYWIKFEAGKPVQKVEIVKPLPK